MKKMVAIFIANLMMLSNAFGADVTVKLNNQEVTFPNQPPTIVEGRTLIPLRSIFENLGYEVEWDANTKTAILKSDDTTITIQANAQSFSVNSDTINLDIPAQIINGSMMLPLRAIGEASGLEVNWNEAEKTVELGPTENKAIEYSQEVKDFYSNFYDMNILNGYFTYVNNYFGNELLGIADEFTSGRLAATKASKTISDLKLSIDKVYNEVNLLSVNSDCSNAKIYLLDYTENISKMYETYLNIFEDVYPDIESLESDLNSVAEVMRQNYSLFDSEISKISNKLNNFMYANYDTEKDSEEKKADINVLIEQLKPIDEKYPIFRVEEDDINLDENIDERIETLKTAAEGRKEMLKDVNIPESCITRGYLIEKSCDVLDELAVAFEDYKNDGDTNIKTSEIRVLSLISIFDALSTMGADYSIGTFYASETKEFELDTHTDDEYKDITIDNVSQETLDFVNLYYYSETIDDYLSNATFLDFMYLPATDENTSRLSYENDYTTLKAEKTDNIEELKNLTVSESTKDLKSAAINYLQIDMEYDELFRQLDMKEITQQQYDIAIEELTEKSDYAYEVLEGEFDRIDQKLSNYVYDYLYMDSVRTESKELEDFGAAINEINEKYPIAEDLNYFYENGENFTQFTNKDVSGIKARADKIIANIQSREAEYANVTVPESCEKRYELLTVVNSFIIEHANLSKNIVADNSDSAQEYFNSLNSIWSVYSDLMSIAAGDSADSLYPEFEE